MMKKHILLFLFIMLLSAGGVHAQVGITSVPFLQIEPDSRAAGMGNTGVALADNASAVFWNPAGLGFQRGNQVNVTHAQWLPNFNADLFYDYLVGSYELSGGTLGGHLSYLNLGEQIRTDDAGLDQGRFNSYELAGGLSYGFQVNDQWSLGTGLRFIYSSLTSGEVAGQSVSPGSSIGVDLAGMYKSNPFIFIGRSTTINAGLNLSNLGPGLSYTSSGQKDPLPTVLRVGWALTAELDDQGMNTLTLANDFSKMMVRSNADGALEALFSSWGNFERDNGQEVASLSPVQQLMIGTGLEYWYNELFSLRGGYYYEDPNNGNREFLTFGAGLRYNFIGVDFSYIYALEDDHPLANTTRFGLLLNF